MRTFDGISIPVLLLRKSKGQCFFTPLCPVFKRPFPQAQVDDVQLANGAGDNDFSASSPFDLGEGLTMDGSIAHRLFQFQLTGVGAVSYRHTVIARSVLGCYYPQHV